MQSSQTMTQLWTEDRWTQCRVSHAWVFWDLNLHRKKQKQATSHDKVKHKLLFYLCLNHLPPSPLLLLYLLSLGSQASVPQKADMPKLRGVGAMGGDGQLCGHLDRASTEHMQQFSSAAPTHYFWRHSLDLQRQQDSVVDKYKDKVSPSITPKIKGLKTILWLKWSETCFHFNICALDVVADKGICHFKTVISLK